MMELCLKASHGYPLVFNPEQGFNRASKDLRHLIHNHSSNRDIVSSISYNLSTQQKELILDSNPIPRIDSNAKRPALVDVQGNRLDSSSLLFCFGVAEQCSRQEILKLLTSRSIKLKDGLLDLSMLYDLLGPRQPLDSLIHPSSEFYLNEPLLDVCMLSDISDHFLSENRTRSSKLTMLVPYFERRRRRGRSNAAAASSKLAPMKSNEKAKEKTSQKKKNSSRTPKERDIYGNSYLHAFEHLLSIIVNRKQQDRNTIISLKKSSSQLPQLLTQFSATIAGTGIAVVLSTFCRIAPFSASKILRSGLGLGLMWLSWGVNKLRDTVICISKSSGKLGSNENQMMKHLDRNLRDVYVRAAVLMLVVVLQVA